MNHSILFALFPPLPSVSSTGNTKEALERETTFWRERGWERSQIILYDGEKTWSSINVSILPGRAKKQFIT